MTTATQDDVSRIRDMLRKSGMRWTPQRRLILGSLLDSAGGHVTSADLVDRIKQIDPQTQPSTVYRTLDMLEENGVVCHSHGHDGREEYHVLPAGEHAHLLCEKCGRSWEVAGAEMQPLTKGLEAGRAFQVNLSHLTVSGVCADCAKSGSSPA